MVCCNSREAMPFLDSVARKGRVEALSVITALVTAHQSRITNHESPQL
jgi:hypothetical protein